MLRLIKKVLGQTRLPVPRQQLQNGTIIDVRTPAEYQRGHVVGSRNIPLSDVEQSVLKIRRFKQPIITCCRSGNRSGMAARILKERGIEAVNGGAWQEVRDQLGA